MKIELTPDESRVLMSFIDITLKVKGTEALDAAALFKLKILQAEQEEKNEKITNLGPPVAADAASQPG